MNVNFQCMYFAYILRTCVEKTLACIQMLRVSCNKLI